MSTTAEINGFFSREHRLLVVLLCMSLYGLFSVYTQQQEMLSEIKLINFRLNEASKTNKDKLVKIDFSGRKRKSKFQTSDFPLFGNMYRRWCGVQNTDRIHTAISHTELCSHWLNSIRAVYPHHTKSNVIN